MGGRREKCTVMPEMRGHPTGKMMTRKKEKNLSSKLWNCALQCSSADSDLVLDPHISYEGMKLDYANDVSLSAYLKSSNMDMY